MLKSFLKISLGFVSAWTLHAETQYPADPFPTPIQIQLSDSSAPPIGNISGKRLRKPAPLQRLIFSARKGFSLSMVSNEEVTAELRNGAGRTLARANYLLEVGEWKLHPKNLPTGVYTVLLRNGSQFRSMRMKIDDVERGLGPPEWVLEKVIRDTASAPSDIQGQLFPVPEL